MPTLLGAKGLGDSDLQSNKKVAAATVHFGYALAAEPVTKIIAARPM